MEKNITAISVLKEVERYIGIIEAKKRARGAGARVTLDIGAVYNDLSIFDWYKDTLSLTNLKDMRMFLIEALNLGYTGYVCFKVGATYSASGMWAHTELSTDGYSPETGKCLYKTFSPDCNYWQFADLDKNEWYPDYDDYNALTTVRKFELAYAQHKFD